ncbi:MAG: hypothetical protein ABSB82_22810 [Terriglobia bacterium]|jgi:hypothetical protein
MKRLIVFLLSGAACLGLGWAAYQSVAPAEPPISKYVPADALLYLQAKDFSSLLSGWNGSPQKQQWLKSANYEVFSRSRLFLRLKEAGDQFAAAAGLPPDMSFLTQVAGSQSALALYDIGKLQFLGITRLPSANSVQSALWQARSKFETRSAGGVTFYLRRDPESKREVEFAASGDYLLLATREDLMAGALQLMSGSKDRTVEDEEWWSQSVAAAGPSGDLRMVLNLGKLVPSPYFRSHWVQQNITDMKQYTAAISDLFLSGNEYREERVLLKAAPSSGAASPDDGPRAVADVVNLVPDNAALYEAQADPSVDSCFDLLVTKILAPHLGASPTEKLAPQVQLTSGETGTGSDLETRIDQAPSQSVVSAEGSSPLKDLLKNHSTQAALRVQSTDREQDGVFVRIHSAVALVGSAAWDEASVRSALVDFVRPGLTASQLGVGWQQKSGYQELDGLWTLLAAVRGKYLLISDDPTLMSTMLANVNRKGDVKPAVFIAGFSHQRERDNFVRLTALIDRPSTNPGGAPAMEREPQFFSENIASLSSTLASVSSEKIVVRDAGDKELQTVTYQWAQ